MQQYDKAFKQDAVNYVKTHPELAISQCQRPFGSGALEDGLYRIGQRRSNLYLELGGPLYARSLFVQVKFTDPEVCTKSFEWPRTSIGCQAFQKSYNSHQFQKKMRSRATLFAEEIDLLNPFPKQRYELATWRTATVQPNYHVAVHKMYSPCPFSISARSYRRASIRFSYIPTAHFCVVWLYNNSTHPCC
jgi:hypothetical protein